MRKSRLHEITFLGKAETAINLEGVGGAWGRKDKAEELRKMGRKLPILTYILTGETNAKLRREQGTGTLKEAAILSLGHGSSQTRALSPVVFKVSDFKAFLFFFLWRNDMLDILS